jgi:hypothetical protein
MQTRTNLCDHTSHTYTMQDEVIPTHRRRTRTSLWQARPNIEIFRQLGSQIYTAVILLDDAVQMSEVPHLSPSVIHRDHHIVLATRIFLPCFYTMMRHFARATRNLASFLPLGVHDHPSRLQHALHIRFTVKSERDSTCDGYLVQDHSIITVTHGVHLEPLIFCRCARANRAGCTMGLSVRRHHVGNWTRNRPGCEW